MKQSKPTLIEYVGPAGAGKTTLANQKIDELRAKGYKVIAYNFYQKNIFCLLQDVLIFPFFLSKKFSDIKLFNSFLNHDSKHFYSRYHVCILVFFTIFKLSRLYKRAQKKKYSFVIIDQGLVQQVCSLMTDEYIDTFPFQEDSFYFRHITYFELIRVRVPVLTAINRRKKRLSKIDVGKTKEEMIIAHKKFCQNLDLIQSSLESKIKFQTIKNP